MNHQQATHCTETEFSQATSLLEKLFDSRKIARLLHRDGSANGQQVYTNAATIFALILQRLGGGLTLKETVKRMVQDHQDLMQQSNRRVKDQTVSQDTSAYDKARRKLLLKKVAAFCDCVAQELADRAGGHFGGRRVYIVDGTTIALPPTRDLAEHFPPASNQFGRTAWPMMQLLVAHELESSCCLTPEIGAMYCNKSGGETKLFKSLVKRMPHPHG